MQPYEHVDNALIRYNRMNKTRRCCACVLLACAVLAVPIFAAARGRAEVSRETKRSQCLARAAKTAPGPRSRSSPSAGTRLPCCSAAPAAAIMLPTAGERNTPAWRACSKCGHIVCRKPEPSNLVRCPTENDKNDLGCLCLDAACTAPQPLGQHLEYMPDAAYVT